MKKLILPLFGIVISLCALQTKADNLPILKDSTKNTPAIYGWKGVFHVQREEGLRPNLQFFIGKNDKFHEFELSTLNIKSSTDSLNSTDVFAIGLTYSRKDNFRTKDKEPGDFRTYWVLELEPYFSSSDVTPLTSTSFRQTNNEFGLVTRLGVGARWFVSERVFLDVELTPIAMTTAFLGSRNHNPSLTQAQQKTSGFTLNQNVANRIFEFGVGVTL